MNQELLGVEIEMNVTLGELLGILNNIAATTTIQAGLPLFNKLESQIPQELKEEMEMASQVANLPDGEMGVVDMQVINSEDEDTTQEEG